MDSIPLTNICSYISNPASSEPVASSAHLEARYCLNSARSQAKQGSIPAHLTHQGSSTYTQKNCICSNIKVCLLCQANFIAQYDLHQLFRHVILSPDTRPHQKLSPKRRAHILKATDIHMLNNTRASNILKTQKKKKVIKPILADYQKVMVSKVGILQHVNGTY